MTDPKEITHKAGCHCGAVTFEFEAPATVSQTRCNCSICSMTGYQHVFVPQGKLRLKGAEALTLYQFGSKAAQHLFCKICGVKPLYIPRSHPESYSVNYRCVAPGTMDISEIIEFDGQNWEKNIQTLKKKT